jgi:hypothetical protein
MDVILRGDARSHHVVAPSIPVVFQRLKFKINKRSFCAMGSLKVRVLHRQKANNVAARNSLVQFLPHHVSISLYTSILPCLLKALVSLFKQICGQVHEQRIDVSAQNAHRISLPTTTHVCITSTYPTSSARVPQKNLD